MTNDMSTEDNNNNDNNNNKSKKAEADEPKNDNTISQRIEVNGKTYDMKGTVSITLTEVKDTPFDPDPEDPNVPRPTEGTVLHGGWGGNMDPKTWIRTVMRNPASQFKVVDGAGKNIATNFTNPENADNFIKFFQRHTDQVSSLFELDGEAPEPGKPGGGEPLPGGGEIPEVPIAGGQTVLGITFPAVLTGKKRADDYHYNANDGLRVDFEGNPADGSYVNSALVVFGTFVNDPTAEEDRCVKWSWDRHSQNGARVNTYIVNIRNSDGAPRMRMEVTHPKGYETMVDWQENKAGTPAKKGQLWSIMGVRRNVLDADGKPVAVKLEVWEDQGIVDNKPGNKWVKLLEHTDTKYKIFTYPNSMEVTGRFDDDKGDKNIKIQKAVLVELEPIKQ